MKPRVEGKEGEERKEEIQRREGGGMVFIMRGNNRANT